MKIKKILALALAAVLLVAVSVGGTMAWLVAETGEITNTFSTSNVGVTLTETTTNYKMIPGHTIDKNPKVKLTENSEDSYVFVEVKKSANFDEYMTYETEWTQLSETKNADGTVTLVYYTTMTATQEAKSFLKDDKVTVKEGVTNTMMNAAKDNQPTLTFKAYAVQLNETNNTPFATPAEAWAAVKNPTAQ